MLEMRSAKYFDRLLLCVNAASCVCVVQIICDLSERSSRFGMCFLTAFLLCGETSRKHRRLLILSVSDSRSVSKGFVLDTSPTACHQPPHNLIQQCVLCIWSVRKMTVRLLQLIFVVDKEDDLWPYLVEGDLLVKRAQELANIAKMALTPGKAALLMVFLLCSTLPF